MTAYCGSRHRERIFALPLPLLYEFSNKRNGHLPDNMKGGVRSNERSHNPYLSLPYFHKNHLFWPQRQEWLRFNWPGPDEFKPQALGQCCQKEMAFE